MADSQGGRINENSAATGKKDEAYLEDEINLIDYFVILWKRKTFIFLATFLPTLIVGITLFLWPRDYKITYFYDSSLNEKGYKVLLDKFYSEENIDKLTTKLKENGFDRYAKKITKTKNVEDLRKLVNSEISPPFFDDGGSSGKIVDVDNLQKIQQLRGSLLVMTIQDTVKKDLIAISSIVKDNFEKVVPIYSVKEGLLGTIKSLNIKIADIEGGRFSLELDLKTKNATFEKLKNLKSGDLSDLQNNVILQFNNVETSSAYLPLTYQIQAVNSQIVTLEESIKANEERFNYYKDMLNINERLLDEIKNKISLYYTIQEFHSFLTTIANDYKGKEQIDYLHAYIKGIENKIMDTLSLTTTPKVYPIAKETVKKSRMVFAIAFLVSVFSAFLREGLEKNRTRISS
jgi:hypothetical protein